MTARVPQIDIPEEEEDAAGLPSHFAATSRSSADLYRLAQIKKESIIRRLKKGTEGTIALVGQLAGLERPVVAFVRMAEGIIMPNALEVPLPMRSVTVSGVRTRRRRRPISGSSSSC